MEYDQPMQSNWFHLMAGLLIFAMPSLAQSDKWRDVEMLRPGTDISVLKNARSGCEFVRATETQLMCERHVGEIRRELVFARDQVKEVRLEDLQKNRLILGAVAGGVAGGLLGFVGSQRSGDPEARVYGRVYGVPIGALVGGAVGLHIHRHGVVIYRR